MAGGVGPVGLRGIDDRLADVITVCVHRSGAGVDARGTEHGIGSRRTHSEQKPSVVSGVAGNGEGITVNAAVCLSTRSRNYIRDIKRVNGSKPVFVAEILVDRVGCKTPQPRIRVDESASM